MIFYIFLLYFCIAHFVFLMYLVNNLILNAGQFNFILAKSYLWPFMLITKLHLFLAHKLATLFDSISIKKRRI
jgi:hypothetical protein